MHVDSGRVSLRTESCQHWPWEKLRCLSLFQSRLTGNQKRMVGDMSQDDFFQQWPRTVPTVLTPQSLLLSGTLCFKHFVSRGLLASTVWVLRRGLAQIFSHFFFRHPKTCCRKLHRQWLAMLLDQCLELGLHQTS